MTSSQQSNPTSDEIRSAACCDDATNARGGKIEFAATHPSLLPRIPETLLMMGKSLVKSPETTRFAKEGHNMMSQNPQTNCFLSSSPQRPDGHEGEGWPSTPGHIHAVHGGLEVVTQTTHTYGM